MRKAFGRAAFALAAGLAVFALGPQRLMAAPAGDETATEQSADAGKPLALTKQKKPRVQKVSRTRKPAKVALAKPTKRQPAQTAAAPAASIPDTVANAKAQMPTAEAHGEAAAVDVTPAPLEAAAADQLTELDRALAATPVEQPQQIAQLAEAPAAKPAPASEPARPMTQARASASTDAWAQSSLIGKIFIAFGGMLTLASAARMLIA